MLTTTSTRASHSATTTTRATPQHRKVVNNTVLQEWKKESCNTWLLKKYWAWVELVNSCVASKVFTQTELRQLFIQTVQETFPTCIEEAIVHPDSMATTVGAQTLSTVMLP
ncbi:uncharacterized protein LOC131648305 [Vicia villosa]|uniref:uncharacterized protein LOC131648305 n=1 Tax=Vicia villosa TaxID=3911 RepID=UPI00273ABA2D|nr:uncharacterized protein LOC131648305 [Vicia villosa]